MTTKLTLSIKEETVQRAKRISKKRGKSISKMFEEYLDSIVEKETDASPLEAILKITMEHRNKVSIPVDGDYNKMVNDWRYEEYNNNSQKIED
jgi:hypothetical protein